MYYTFYTEFYWLLVIAITIKNHKKYFNFGIKF